MGRAPCCEKVGLRRGRWTTEEDEKLINYIHQHGEGSWRSLPKNAGLLRCGKSCRLRWINYLRTDLKRGNITPQEEETIIRLHSIMGNRWSLIAGQLSGRTDNEIKNYWNSHLSRKIHTFIRPNGDPNGGKIIINMTHASAPPKRRGGRTSRAEMQRNRANNNANNNKNNEASSTQGKNVNNSNRLKNGNHQNDSVLDDNKTGPLNSTDEKSDLNDLIGPQGEGSELLDIEDLMGLDGVDPQWYSNNNTINSDGPNIAFDMGPVSSTGTGVLSTAGSSTASSSYVDHHDHDNQQRSMVDWEWDWDWEIGTVDHVGKEYQQVWNDKEQIISWLWENDDENSLENFNFNYLNDNNNDCNNVDLSTLPDVVDSDKEQAMVAWLLS